METRYQYKVCFSDGRKSDGIFNNLFICKKYADCYEAKIERREVKYSDWSLYDPNSSTALDSPGE